LARFVDRAVKGMTLMKVSVVAAAIVLALAGSALAEDNGLMLGKSMPGTNAGVPYPNPATMDRPAPAVDNSMKQPVTIPPKHRKKRAT
jgi:hypothetical protein